MSFFFNKKPIYNTYVFIFIYTAPYNYTLYLKQKYKHKFDVVQPDGFLGFLRYRLIILNYIIEGFWKKKRWLIQRNTRQKVYKM